MSNRLATLGTILALAMAGCAPPHAATPNEPSPTPGLSVEELRARAASVADEKAPGLKRTGPLERTTVLNFVKSGRSVFTFTRDDDGVMRLQPDPSLAVDVFYYTADATASPDTRMVSVAVLEDPVRILEVLSTPRRWTSFALTGDRHGGVTGDVSNPFPTQGDPVTFTLRGMPPGREVQLVLVRQDLMDYTAPLTAPRPPSLHVLALSRQTTTDQPLSVTMRPRASMGPGIDGLPYHGYVGTQIFLGVVEATASPDLAEITPLWCVIQPS